MFCYSQTIGFNYGSYRNNRSITGKETASTLRKKRGLVLLFPTVHTSHPEKASCNIKPKTDRVEKDVSPTYKKVKHG